MKEYHEYEQRLGRNPGCTEKSTPAQIRRATEQTEAAAEKAALAAEHYLLFPEVPQ